MGLKRKLAEQMVNMAALPPFRKLLFRLGRSQGIIFMLHRFDLSPYGIEGIKGHNLEFLEKCLIDLKQSGHNLVTVDEMFQAAREGRVIENAVAFTIDDGFFDHGVVAEKIFAKHQVPVTIYLVTDFVDGKYWLTDSRIEYILRHANLASFELELDGKHYKTCTLRELERQIIWHAKTMPLEQAEQLIARLAAQLNVEVPDTAPDLFKPICWDEARRLEKLGVRFGAHTAQHPTLSVEDDSHSEYEIKHACRRLNEELAHPSEVFCYPTGRLSDFGEREEVIVKELGLLGAISTVPGHFDLKTSIDQTDFYRIPRFSWSNSKLDLNQYIHYLEYLKAIVH